MFDFSFSMLIPYTKLYILSTRNTDIDIGCLYSKMTSHGLFSSPFLGVLGKQSILNWPES